MAAAATPVATHLLLVADNLPEHELLTGAVTSNVKSITVDFESWSVPDLQKAIEDACGPSSQQFAGVAILGHGQPGYFEILKSVQGEDKTSLEESVINFCGWLGEYVQRDGQIHLLGCECAEGPDGKKLLKTVQQATDRKVRASTKKHGAGVDVTDEFYWGLSHGRDRGESRPSIASDDGTADRTVTCSQEELLDASKIYFEEVKLQQWIHTAGSVDNYGDNCIKGGLITIASSPATGPAAPFVAAGGIGAAVGGCIVKGLFGRS